MSQFSKLNYINVGPHGTFKPSGDTHTNPEDIDQIFEHIKSENITKLAIHFHGGLVNEGAGLNVAQSMMPVYEAGNAHPLTIVWETGLLETIGRNLNNIHSTKLFQKLITYIFRQLTKRLGADISGRGPNKPMTIEEIEKELEKLDKFESFESSARSGSSSLTIDDLENAKNQMEIEYKLDFQQDLDFQNSETKIFHENTYLNAEKQKDLKGQSSRGLDLLKLAKAMVSVTYRVLKRFLEGRDHDIYPTAVEEILREFYLADFGEWVWDGMKDIAVNMWLPNNNTISQDSHPGTYLLRKLNEHVENNPSFTIDVVGHSAGSIAICNMLKSAYQTDQMPRLRNIIFLAPACSTKLMYEEVVKHPDRYEGFRMFTMSDEYEKKDRLVPVIYTRSLLYFISGVLESEVDIPLAGMERFWTQQEPFSDDYLVECASWLKDQGSNRGVLSVTNSNLPGFTSNSEKHGDFDNDPKTCESITYIVSENGSLNAV